MALGPVVSAAPVSANVLLNVADVSDYIQDLDAGDIGLAINRVCRLAEETTSKISTIKLNRGSYTLSTTVDLPKTSASVPRFLTFDFRGVVIDASGTIAFRKLPSSNTEANATIVKLVPKMEGVEVTNATVAFDIGGTYGLYLENCSATSCATGFRLSFCLNATLKNCYATACTDHSFHVRSGNGVWTGATVANSASNVSRLEGCRSWTSNYECVQFGIYGSDSVRLDGCISEGNSCKYEVFFDAQGSTVVKQFYVHHHHHECGNSDTLLKIIGRDQVVSIDGIDRGAIPARLLDTTGTISTRFEINKWHYMSAYDRTEWTAGTFAAGTRMKYSGKQYTAIEAATASDVPGVSAKWRDDGFFGAFVCDLYEQNCSFFFATNATESMNAAAWSVNGSSQLASHVTNTRFAGGLCRREHSGALGIYSKSNITIDNTGSAGFRDITLNSDNAVVLTTVSGAFVDTNNGFRVNGTELDVP